MHWSIFNKVKIKKVEQRDNREKMIKFNTRKSVFTSTSIFLLYCVVFSYYFYGEPQERRQILFISPIIQIKKQSKKRVIDCQHPYQKSKGWFCHQKLVLLGSDILLSLWTGIEGNPTWAGSTGCLPLLLCMNHYGGLSSNKPKESDEPYLQIKAYAHYILFILNYMSTSPFQSFFCLFQEVQTFNITDIDNHLLMSSCSTIYLLV